MLALSIGDPVEVGEGFADGDACGCVHGLAPDNSLGYFADEQVSTEAKSASVDVSIVS